MSIALSDYDLDRLRGLRRARWRATALLVTVAGVFVLTFSFGEATWVGFLRTAAEASLIGGLADWFAVTALFRHPLGLPIPHTAIIPRSKTGLARSLGEFVRHNFLSPEQLSERLEAARLPHRLGAWLTRDDNADLLAGQVAVTLAALADGLESRDDVKGGVTELLETLPVAGWVGRRAEMAISGGSHEQLVSAAIAGMASVLEDNRRVLREWIADESPWWVPQAVDDAVFARAYDALRRLLLQLAADPHHEVRRAIDRRLLELAHRLQTDPEMSRTLSGHLGDLIGGGFDDVWKNLIDHLTEAGRSPDSQLRVRLTNELRRLGDRLTTDEQLKRQVEAWMRALAGPVSRVGQRELSDLIAITVDRWDPTDTSRRLELWMGRDLQFVRINGTVVGGLVGLAIHTVVYFLAG